MQVITPRGEKGRTSKMNGSPGQCWIERGGLWEPHGLLAKARLSFHKEGKLVRALCQGSKWIRKRGLLMC
jgi:hypothetical protein